MTFGAAPARRVGARARWERWERGARAPGRDPILLRGRDLGPGGSPGGGRGLQARHGPPAWPGTSTTRSPHFRGHCSDWSNSSGWLLLSAGLIARSRVGGSGVVCASGRSQGLGLVSVWDNPPRTLVNHTTTHHHSTKPASTASPVQLNHWIKDKALGRTSLGLTSAFSE